MTRRLSESRGASDPQAAAIIVPALVELFAPQSVVDFGCGSATWVREFAARGVRAIGFDSRPPKGESYRQCNLETDMPQAKGDLALCLEVAEHLSVARAPVLVKTLSTFPLVVFAAGIPLQGGWGHVNEQWPDYWARLFAAHGYACSEDLRWRFWDDSRIPAWYRQDLLVFGREDTLARHGLTQSTPRRVVHPDTWQRLGPMAIYQRLASAFPAAPAVAFLTLAYALCILLISNQ